MPPGTGAPALGSGGIPPGLYSQGPRKRINEGRKEVENGAGEADGKTRKMNSSRSVEALDGRASWRNVMDMERRKEEIKVYGDAEAKLDTVAGQFNVSNPRRRMNQKRASMGAFVFK